VIKDLGGELKVESALNVGTTFDLSFRYETRAKKTFCTISFTPFKQQVTKEKFEIFILFIPSKTYSKLHPQLLVYFIKFMFFNFNFCYLHPGLG
jgi:hypothetical protein